MIECSRMYEAKLSPGSFVISLSEIFLIIGKKMNRHKPKDTQIQEPNAITKTLNKNNIRKQNYLQ